MTARRPAPPVAEEGTSPYTTPGTRRQWGSGEEWVRHAMELQQGRISSKIHRDRDSHLDELARHPDFIAAQPLEELEQIKAVLTLHYRPPRGARAGTSYERVLNEVNNAIQRTEWEQRLSRITVGG